MSCLFELKEAYPKNETIVLGYSPQNITSNSFCFSPIPITHTHQINYEVGTEEGVAILLAYFLCKNPSEKLKSIFKEIDIGYLSAETNIGEEEFAELQDFICNKTINILLTSDFLSHPCSSNILAIISEISLEPNILCFIDQPLPKKCDSLPESNGIVLRVTQGHLSLIGSSQFAIFTKLFDGDTPTIIHQDFCIQAPFHIDPNLKGTIGILSIPDIFTKYPYQQVQIKR